MNHIIQWNCRGLRNKWPEIQFILSSLHPKIFCLAETHLIPHDQPYFKLNTYHSYHHHACNTRRKGGTSIFVHTSLPHHPIQLTGPHQATAIQVTINNITLTVCSLYIPPALQTDNNFYESLIQQLPPPFILCGDFNAKHQLWGSTAADRRGHILEQIITQRNLHILNDGSPTHLHDYNGTLTHIDISLCTPSLAPKLNWKCHESLHGSDHFPISISFLPHSSTSQQQIRWNTKHANWNTYNQILSTYCITANHETMIPQLTHHILSAAQKSIPSSKTARTPRRSCPWWNSSCKTAIQKRKQALRYFRLHRTTAALETYKITKAEARKIIRTAKRSSWTFLTSSFTHRSPLSKLWHVIRSFKQIDRPPPSLPVSRIGNTIITDQPFVLHQLASYYSNISKPPSNAHSSTSVSPPITHNTISTLHPYNNPFTIQEFNRCLSLCSSKSAGPDQLLYCFFQNMTLSNKNTVLHCLNKIWTHDFFPPAWKHSYIIPILKPGKPSLEHSSYRPIQLTSCFSKLYERLIQPRLLSFTQEHSLISPQQTAYTKNRSTTDNVNYLVSHIRLAYAKNYSTLAVFLDLSSAFNTVSKNAILSIFTKNGLRGHLLHFLIGYLSDRTFQVKTTHISSRFSQDSGVVQGGVLSPTLFNVAVDQLTRNLSEHIKYSLYADDLVIWTSGPELHTQATIIQTALNTIANRCSSLGFKISTAKTTATLFRKHSSKQPSHPLLTINRTHIHFHSTTKYLGVHLDARLSFKTHIQHSKTRAIKRISIIKCLSHPQYGADRIILTRLYNTLIRPILEYCSTIYAFLPTPALVTYNTIQNTCLRIASGALRTSPINKLLPETGARTLHLRRIKQIIQYGLKISSDTNHPCHSLLHCLMSLQNLTAAEINRLCGHTIGLSYHSACKLIGFLPPTLFPPVEIPNTEHYIPQIHLMHPSDLTQHTQQSFLEYKAKYEHHTFIYTDGSARNDTTGCAVVLPSRQLEFSYRLPPRTSVFNAEQFAILQAVKLAKQHKISNTTIVTDSLSALKSLQHPKNTISTLTLQTLLDLPKHFRLIFLWVPSHTGITGNELADKAAKHALSLSIISTPPLSPVDTYPELNRKLTLYWNSQINIQNHNRHQHRHYTHGVKDIHCHRRLSITLTRLRIGHTLLTHRHIIDHSPPPVCHRCRTALTVEHILFHCLNYRTQRSIIFTELTNRSREFTSDNILYNPYYQPHLLKFITSTSLHKKL